MEMTRHKAAQTLHRYGHTSARSATRSARCGWTSRASAAAAGAGSTSAVLPLVAGIRLHAHHLRRLPDRLLPHLALGDFVDPEALELDPRARLAGAPLDPAVAHQVERRDPLGDPRRGVVVGRRERDPVGETDAPGALARRREEDLRRGRVRVFLVFGQPCAIPMIATPLLLRAASVHDRAPPIRALA